ncbi:hypothetical protein F5Y06DRAFT_284025 [Hypoxylon sp. FL0890]|nr:hypothetical protein F5Y06DRAFT_284025 [Hypoxylon sp. FL0890]
MESRDLPFSRAAGHVNYQARLSPLRQFVFDSSLTSEELRYVKILLSRVHIDIIDELPIELVRQIAELLDLHHFAACLAVSKRWRNKFLSISVIRAVLNNFCSSLEQVTNPTQISPDGCLKALHRIGRLRSRCFQSSLTKQLAWEHESYFKPDPDYHGNYEDVSTVYAQFCRHNQNPEFWTNPMYSNGKIVWCPKPHIVVVDNLWSRTRKIFNMPTGPLIGPALHTLALGNRLVVGFMDHILVAWDHVTNVRLEKKLPGAIRHVATEGSRVAVVLLHGDVLLWEFGGKLFTVASVPLKKSSDAGIGSLNLRAIFHPGCSETLFITDCYIDYVNSKAVIKQKIYEFTDANHVNTFENEITPETFDKIGPAATSRPEVRKLLPYRRDIIAFLERHPSSNSRSASDPCETTSVEFDIYDRKFTSQIGLDYHYCTPGWPEFEEDADLDFVVRWDPQNPSFTVYSLQPGFDFKADE